jgi:hypothetical protein
MLGTFVRIERCYSRLGHVVHTFAQACNCYHCVYGISASTVVNKTKADAARRYISSLGVRNAVRNAA